MRYRKENWGGEYLYYLPWYDQENIHFLDIARVLELMFRLLESQLEIIERNLFIDTAIEALPIFQRDLGLRIDDSLPLEKKRSIIKEYLKYLHQQTTEKVVQDLCRSFDTRGVKFRIFKNHEKTDTYRLVMYISSGGDHSQHDLTKLLEKVLPAHHDFILELVYQLLLVLENYIFDYNYPIYFCGEETCGDVPYRYREVDVILESFKVVHGTNRSEKDVYFTSEGHHTGTINSQDDGQIFYIQDLKSRKIFDFTDFE